MSWSLSHSGPARDASARHEAAIGVAIVGRNAYEQNNIRSTQETVEKAVKHAHLTDHIAQVSAGGHTGEDGLGGFSLSIQISAKPAEPVAPAEAQEPATASVEG
jgi:hypothetical protein